jgi:hypothetical protein
MTVAIESQGICDFCSSRDVAWTYPARNISLEDINATSMGAWLACNACHALVERGDRGALVERAFTAPLLQALAEDARSIAFVQRLQAGFFANRLGPAERVERR